MWIVLFLFLRLIIFSTVIRVFYSAGLSSFLNTCFLKDLGISFGDLGVSSVGCSIVTLATG